MKIHMESTPEIAAIDGVPCRVWEGRTESGIPVLVLVHRIAVDQDRDTAQFEAELLEQEHPKEITSPSPERRTVPATDSRRGFPSGFAPIEPAA